MRLVTDGSVEGRLIDAAARDAFEVVCSGAPDACPVSVATALIFVFGRQLAAVDPVLTANWFRAAAAELETGHGDVSKIAARVLAAAALNDRAEAMVEKIIGGNGAL